MANVLRTDSHAHQSLPDPARWVAPTRHVSPDVLNSAEAANSLNPAGERQALQKNGMSGAQVIGRFDDVQPGPGPHGAPPRRPA